MFLPFFDQLRQHKVPVSMREFLAFLDGMAAGLATYDVDAFYYLARTSMVKDERNIDKFDRAFAAAFSGLENISLDDVMEAVDIPHEWLEKMAEKHLTPEEKAEIAKACGCDHTILYNTEVVAARVKEITDGTGAAVSYDGVGQSTYTASLDSLKPMGYMVSFGNASGPVSTIEVAELASRGGLFFTRPSLMPHTATREMLVDLADALTEVIGSGTVKISVNQTYPLSDTEQAHRDLEARRTTGCTVLLP